MRAYLNKPDEQRPHLHLVPNLAGREPLADPTQQTPASRESSLPNDPVGHAASDHEDGPQAASRPATIDRHDIVDLAYLSALLLPRFKQAVAELERAVAEGDHVGAITACRRLLACSLTAKTRADSLERRLP